MNVGIPPKDDVSVLWCIAIVPFVPVMLIVVWWLTGPGEWIEARRVERLNRGL